MKLEKMEKITTGFYNTPIHKLENLSKKYGINMYIKRDDLTGYATGGNKLRKLDYLLKDALDKGCTVLLTYGGQQTNHGRLTAAVAARFGLRCGIIMDGAAPAKATGNLILDRMMGADLFFMDDTSFRYEEPEIKAARYQELVEKTTDEVVKMYEDAGEKVYMIPIGGSSPVGAAGYVMAAKEIKDQLQEMNVKIDYVFTGFGSVGTFGGLYLGAKYFKADFMPVGICVSHKTEEELLEKVDYIKETNQFLELGVDVSREDMWIEDGYVGISYNVPDEITRQYMYLMAREEAIILDPCYTGKVFRGMIEMIQSGKISRGDNVMLMHTGGIPGIFSESHSESMQHELWGETQKEFRL
ncbi:MAG: D-cysteine desulfhydrase family protein [Sedimentibacter sp.]|uniref:1-aminocyclopropane-1-carboxylate deaminase/D-cysteine desulfhydrase n=1 Tax=Sedimentibacter sp. TaxID=1960295 RepID=UPI0031595BBD